MMASCGGSDTLYEAGSIWKFLDKLALTNPDGYKQYIEKVMKEGEEHDFGPPVAKFVVETSKTPKVIPDRRYFINIGEWKQVPKPESKSSPIPILASEPRKELVGKEWAMLVDIVLNPTIFTECHNNFDKCSIVELVLKYIEDKNGLNLSRKYQFLDDKYKGNQDHLLNFMCPTSLQESFNSTVNGKLTRESVIEKMKQLPSKKQVHDTDVKNDEISDNLNWKNDERPSIPSLKNINPVITANLNTPALTEQNTKTIKNGKKSKLKRPKVEMEVNKEEGNVELTVYLPEVESVQECDLELRENRLSLVAFEKYQLELDLPVSINIEDSKAKFVKDLKTLLITANINIPPKIS